jgi:hypothetical protein
MLTEKIMNGIMVSDDDQSITRAPAFSLPAYSSMAYARSKITAVANDLPGNKTSLSINMS